MNYIRHVIKLENGDELHFDTDEAYDYMIREFKHLISKSNRSRPILRAEEDGLHILQTSHIEESDRPLFKFVETKDGAERQQAPTATNEQLKDLFS